MSAPLDFDAAAIMRLIPHRPPMLLVDRVETYQRAPQPTLTASKRIDPDEQVFAGHFPGSPVWPGCYTIEGLAQSCNLLAAIRVIESQCERAGLGLAEALRFLAHPDACAGAPLEQVLRSFATAPPIGFLGAVDVRLVEVVRPGCRLTYSVGETRSDGTVSRYAVDALVERTVVARGTITVALARR